MVGIDIKDDISILKCCATLTDGKVKDVIEKTFKTDTYRNLKTWLIDALRVRPVDRYINIYIYIFIHVFYIMLYKYMYIDGPWIN